MPCYPIFCTAKMPAEVLEELLTTRRQCREQTDPTEYDLYFVTPVYDAAEFRDLDTKHGAPPQDLTAIQPFQDWSVQECYSFYKTRLQHRPDQVFGQFTAFTFLILDSDTLSSGPFRNTAILCTDAPDISDIPKRRGVDGKVPVLKFRRLTFWAAAQTMDVWEMMTGMFSDLGQSGQLSFHAESWREHLRYRDDGAEVYRFVTAGEARAKQERLLEEYLDGKRRVDVT